SPCLTSWPSLKWTVSMNPETRARTSTCSTAAKRPVYSSHSVIVFCNGWATVTGGGGGAEPVAGLLSQLASACATRTREPHRIARVIGSFSSTSCIGSVSYGDLIGSEHGMEATKAHSRNWSFG